jgi:uroporphyrinogen-III synthase
VSPIESKRILVTRTRLQASDLAAQLEALGAIPILIPTIEIIPPKTYAPLDAVLANLDTYDWLLFTSANAVQVFEQRRNPSLHPRRIAAIGPATARAVQGIGLRVDLIPQQYIAESFAAALAPHARTAEDRPSNMLLFRAAAARDILPEALTAAGVNLTIAEAYRNRIPPDAIPALQALFASPVVYPDAITFTSTSTARNLFDLLEAANLTLPPNITLASIGPITSRTLRDLGHPPSTEAAEPTIPALIQSLLTALQ